MTLRSATVRYGQVPFAACHDNSEKIEMAPPVSFLRADVIFLECLTKKNLDQRRSRYADSMRITCM